MLPARCLKMQVLHLPGQQQLLQQVIAMNVFSLDASYANLFSATNFLQQNRSSLNAMARRMAWKGIISRCILKVVATETVLRRSRNFVDEFEGKNGTTSVPFDWSKYYTRHANPYNSRDPRLRTAAVVYKRRHQFQINYLSDLLWRKQRLTLN